MVTCAALGIPGSFSGLESLRIKETDRMAALARGTQQFGVQFTQDGDSWNWKVHVRGRKGYTLLTYDDHRMAMAFYHLHCCNQSSAEDSRVVAKSYPSFWDDLSILAFSSPA